MDTTRDKEAVCESEEVLDLLAKAGEQYEAYLILAHQARLGARNEPEPTVTRSWDHPMTLSWKGI